MLKNASAHFDPLHLTQRYDAIVTHCGHEARIRLERASTYDEAHRCARQMGLSPLAFERLVDGYVVGRVPVRTRAHT